MGFHAFLRLRNRLFDRVQTMTIQDMTELAGWLVASWTLGFTGGYLMTKFKHAINQAV